MRKNPEMGSPYQEKVEVEVPSPAQTPHVESWVKMKNLVLRVGDAGIQERVTGMVIEAITDSGNQMVMVGETEKLVMVKAGVAHSFLVRVKVEVARSFLVMEVVAEVEDRSSKKIEVAAQVGKEAIQMIAADVDLAFEFDFDFALEHFADMEDEVVEVLGLDQ